jgi:hypothetical protein
MARRRKSDPVQSNVTDETIRKHMRICSDAKAAVEEANGRYRAFLKAAKLDGVNQGQMIAVMADRKRDTDRVEADLRDRLRMMRLFDMPTTQIELLFGAVAGPNVSAAAADEHDEWSADEAGYEASVKGGQQRSDNPHPAGTLAFAGWDKGWHRGQEKLASDLGPKGRGTKPASTRRARRSNARGAELVQ